MHNVVKQCFCGSNVHCGSCVVTHESNIVSYFHEAGNLSDSNAGMCSDMTEPSGSGTDDLYELSDRSNTSYFYYFPHV